jgi:hypothetical protein
VKGRYTAETSDPDRSRPDEGHLQELLNDVRESLDALDRGPLTDPETDTRKRSPFTALELLRRSRMGSRDGFSTSSVPEALGPAGGHSDRIGDLAASNLDLQRKTGHEADRVRGAVRQVITEIQTARRALSRAADVVVRETPPSARPAEPGCRSCARLTHVDGPLAGKPIWSPCYRGKDGESTNYCRWCYDWLLVHKAEPPEELVELHLRGVKMTSKVVASVMAKKSTTRVRRHRRRR